MKCLCWFTRYNFRGIGKQTEYQKECLKCGHKTNWHTEKWKAATAFMQR